MARLIRGQDAVVGERRLKRSIAPAVGPEARNAIPSQENDRGVSDVARKREIESLFAQELAQIKQQAREGAALEEKMRLEAQLKKDVAVEKERLQQSYEEKMSKADKALSLLTETASSIDADRKKMLAEVEDFAMTLTLECLYKLCGEKSVHQSAVKKVVDDALKRLDEDKKATVRVSEKEFLLFEALPEGAKEFITISPDPELKAGDCIIESGFSTMDMSLTIQLDQIKNTLVKTLTDKKHAAG